MIIFMAQAPILGVLLPLLLLIALFEAIGLKVRRNILMLSVAALVCLLAAMPVSRSQPALASLLYATGVTLAVLLTLYAMLTARRGKQWLWLAGLLLAAVVTLVAGIVVRVAIGGEAADAAAALIFALTFVPGASALVYGMFAPDIPKPRGNRW